MVTAIMICIDFDRDAAFPYKNKPFAVSKAIAEFETAEEINISNALTYKGTEKSFPLLMNFLIENSIPVTFFFEARTLKKFSEHYLSFWPLINQKFFEFGSHGYDHEDLPGKETNCPFTREQEYKCLENSKKQIEKIIKNKVRGFRAPYMRLSNNTLSIIKELGFKYDSSNYLESIKSIKPFLLDELHEFPVIKTPKHSSMNGMYTYLWPMFEAKRTVKETINNYITLVKNSKDNDGYISINLHSWHFAYKVDDNKYLTSKEIENNIDKLRQLIFSLKKIPEVSFMTPTTYIKSFIDN